MVVSGLIDLTAISMLKYLTKRITSDYLCLILGKGFPQTPENKIFQLSLNWD